MRRQVADADPNTLSNSRHSRHRPRASPRGGYPPSGFSQRWISTLPIRSTRTVGRPLAAEIMLLVFASSGMSNGAPHQVHSYLPSSASRTRLSPAVDPPGRILPIGTPPELLVEADSAGEDRSRRQCPFACRKELDCQPGVIALDSEDVGPVPVAFSAATTNL
jgi:hypothetical protein